MSISFYRKASMMNPRDGRAVNQEGWKRTQVRMPQEQYKAIMEYAEQNNLSLNTAMLELMDKGLNMTGNTTLVMSESDSKILEQTLARLQKIDEIEQQLKIAIESLENLQSTNIKKAP